MLDVRRGQSRFVTVGEGRETRHSFSFGPHYDPGNVGFGPLVALNDESLAPGAGYPDHPHAGIEIVTWVLDGALRHSSSLGDARLLGAGTVATQSAGSGLVHAEIGDRDSGPTRFVQTWLTPSSAGGAPSRLRTVEAGNADGLVPVVGGAGNLQVRTPGTLWVGRVEGPVVLPDEPLLHVFVVHGALTGPGVRLAADDALRVTEEAPVLRAADGTRLMVWAFAG